MATTPTFLLGSIVLPEFGQFSRSFGERRVVPKHASVFSCQTIVGRRIGKPQAVFRLLQTISRPHQLIVEHTRTSTPIISRRSVWRQH